MPFFQRSIASRSGPELTGDCQKMRIVRHQDAYCQGSRRRSAQSGCVKLGRLGLPELHQNQHLLVGQSQKAQLQAEKVPHQIAPRRICKLRGSFHFFCKLYLSNLLFTTLVIHIIHCICTCVYCILREERLLQPFVEKYWKV